MQRNGKAPRGAEDTLVVLGMSPEAVGTSPTAVGAPSEAVGTSPTAVGAPSETVGAPHDLVGAPAQPAATPTRRRVASFGRNASMAQRLAAAQIAIETVLSDPALQDRLVAYGYDAARMREGAAIRAQALALFQQQRARFGDLYAATDARAAAQARAHAVYMRHVGVARVALRADRGAAQKLDLAAARKSTQAGWLLQAQQFYANALADPAVGGALARYGVTQEQLQEGAQQVAAVAAGAVTQHTQKGAAQESTRARDAALGALNRWMRDFLAIGRIALADQPQLLEQLGAGVAV